MHSLRLGAKFFLSNFFFVHPKFSQDVSTKVDVHQPPPLPEMGNLDLDLGFLKFGTKIGPSLTPSPSPTPP